MDHRLAYDHDTLFGRCVEVCRSYRHDRVVAANIRSRLTGLSVPREEIDLFAMVLTRHVRQPDDADLGRSARTLWQRLLDLDLKAGWRPGGHA